MWVVNIIHQSEDFNQWCFFLFLQLWILLLQTWAHPWVKPAPLYLHVAEGCHAWWWPREYPAWSGVRRKAWSCTSQSRFLLPLQFTFPAGLPTPRSPPRAPSRGPARWTGTALATMAARHSPNPNPSSLCLHGPTLFTTGLFLTFLISLRSSVPDLFISLHLYLLRSSTPVKPPSSVASSSSSIRPPTPSTSVSLPYSRGSGSSGPIRPPSRANSGAMFTPSPGLPPPPPLLPPANSTAAGTESRPATVHCCFSLLGCYVCAEEHSGCENKPNSDFLWWLPGFVGGIEEVEHWWSEI